MTINSKKAMTIYLFIDPLGSHCYHTERCIYNFKALREENICVQIIPIVNTENIKQAVRKRSVFTQGSPLEIQNALYLNVYHSCLAYIAASMQGRKKARLLLTALQETVINIGEFFSIELLMDIANKLNLDVAEFKQDFYSAFAKKCFIQNQKVAQEMKVSVTPACVISPNDSDAFYQIKGNINENTLDFILEKLPDKAFNQSII